MLISINSINKINKIIAAFISAVLLLAGCASALDNSAAKRELNITLLVDNLGDMSYNDGIVRELRLAEERYRENGTVDLSLSVFEMETGTGKEQTEVSSAFSGDSELIIIANQIALPILEPATAYHPDKKFILIDAEAAGDNIYSAFFKPNEAAYLCGALAAEMSETGTIGIIIGMEITALHDFAVGYIQGAKKVDPDIKVIISAVGNFYDAEIGYELAEYQFEQNVDVTFAAAGGAGLGSIKAASDYGRYIIGVDVDQTEQVEPELKGAILTSCLKNFDMMIASLLDSYINGSLEFGQSGRLGLEEGAVGIARNQYYLDNVPQAVRDEIDGLQAKISSGEIHERTAYEMTQNEINELYNSVRP